jgi:hypothetical protein
VGELRYSSTHSLTSVLDGSEWSASRPSHFIPRERAPGTHWIGGWVGPRAVPDAVVKTKIPSPRRESNTSTPIVQSVAQRYTDWAITALGLLYKLSKFQFSPSIIKLISSFLPNRKFRVTVEGELSTPRDVQGGVPQGSALASTLYTNDTPQTSGVYINPLCRLYVCVCVKQIAKKVVFSESCNAVSPLWSRGVSAGT